MQKKTCEKNPSRGFEVYSRCSTAHAHTHPEWRENLEKKCSTNNLYPESDEGDDEKIKIPQKNNFLSTKSVCKRFQNPCNARNDYIKLNGRQEISLFLHLSKKRPKNWKNCNTFSQHV